jgi:hypothetical protein
MASLLYTFGLWLIGCIGLRLKGVDVASHHIVVRDGAGKNRVTVLPLHIQTRLQRHGHDVKHGMSTIWRRGSTPRQPLVIILALRFSEHNWEQELDRRHGCPRMAHVPVQAGQQEYLGVGTRI